MTTSNVRLEPVIWQWEIQGLDTLDHMREANTELDGLSEQRDFQSLDEFNDTLLQTDDTLVTTSTNLEETGAGLTALQEGFKLTSGIILRFLAPAALLSFGLTKVVGDFLSLDKRLISSTLQLRLFTRDSDETTNKLAELSNILDADVIRSLEALPVELLNFAVRISPDTLAEYQEFAEILSLASGGVVTFEEAFEAFIRAFNTNEPFAFADLLNVSWAQLGTSAQSNFGAIKDVLNQTFNELPFYTRLFFRLGDAFDDFYSSGVIGLSNFGDRFFENLFPNSLDEDGNLDWGGFLLDGLASLSLRHLAQTLFDTVVGDNIENAREFVQGWVDTNIVTPVWDTLQELLINGIAVNAVGAFFKRIGEEFIVRSNEATAWVTGVVTSITEQIEKFVTLGTDIASNLWNGFKDRSLELLGGNLVDDIKNAAEQFLEKAGLLSNSPSELGLDVGAGLVEGIEASLRDFPMDFTFGRGNSLNNFNPSQAAAPTAINLAVRMEIDGRALDARVVRVIQTSLRDTAPQIFV